MENLIDIIFDTESKNGNLLLKLKEKRQKRIKRIHFVLQRKYLNLKTKVPRIVNYFRIIKNYPDDIFHSHFRMSPTIFKELENALRPFWPTERRGRRGFSMEQCLYVTLWKLCNSRVTFRELSDRFNLARGTSHEIFYKTVGAICALKSEIAWPSALQQQNVMENFLNCRHNPFPYVIGCVDGTHIKIPIPKKDAISYYNRKGYYSIILQAICDSKYRFLDVFIGYPGSCDDANVWKNSPIFKAITSGQVELAPNAIILGDSAYPLSKFVMVPYRDNGHLDNAKKKFNYYLSSTRVIIEQTFGILKQKFKILNHMDIETPKAVSSVVMACVILHNFILNKGEDSEYINDISTDTSEIIYDTEASEQTSMPMQEAEESIDGISVRTNLTTLFVS